MADRLRSRDLALKDVGFSSQDCGLGNARLRGPRLPKMASMAKLQSTADTSKEALEVQLACLRHMSSRERIRQTCAMSRRVRNMAMDAIRRRHPDLGDAEVRLMFIELTYGKSLADDIRRWSAERAS